MGNRPKSPVSTIPPLRHGQYITIFFPNRQGKVCRKNTVCSNPSAPRSVEDDAPYTMQRVRPYIGFYAAPIGLPM